ncbi:MAG: hypothetical protein EZS28_002330 [Streblomastix strix]|uniref:Uncharacterized protein n=1 Tax=Streblomastix strix TaxID=222440 RepID=A0A5J4X5N0_9EUKA|nr:MAG: hypothetical protein EZS28_002330 [Streblomastix strix]
MSPRLSVPITPAIVEVDSPFEKEPDQFHVHQCVDGYLNIISEDEHMTKESAHFKLSKSQLIRLIAYTFDVVENQIVLNIENEGCSDIDKFNLLRDSYKLCPQKVREITSIIDLGDISSKLMSAANLHSLDVLIKHDEVLFGSIRYNSIGLVDQVENIINQINMINNAPAPDEQTRPKANEIFDTKADKTDSYTKTETDEKLDLKADKTELIDVYTKFEDDALLLLKANVADIVDSYSKTEDDALLKLKVDKSDTYTKSKDGALLLLKADKTDTYTKSETDTLLYAKANIVDIIDCYSKTDDEAFLLLKADITKLIDSFTKSEDDALLQQKADKTEIIDSYSKIEDDAFLLLKVNVTDLANNVNLTSAQTIIVGDNLYIVDKEVTNYWWDGTDLKVLETDLPDMNNVKTTLKTATGGVGIMVQTYDNSGVVCSKGRVLSIADIQSASYSKQEDDAHLLLKADKSTTYIKIEDDALLLLKADKTQLIDSYTKGETNNFIDNKADTGGEKNKLLNNKADTGVSYLYGKDDALLLLKADKSTTYTKTQDDTLLLLKVDETQLIDSRTKDETNNFLNNKEDIGVSYTKDEDNTLLLLKVDKTQLIDSYSRMRNLSQRRSDVDALLLLKVDKSTTYAKTQDDTLLQLKADKTQLIDSYSKDETNNLLNNKANNEVSQAKGEDDALLLLKAYKQTTQTQTQDDALLLLIADKTQLIDYYSKIDTNNILNNKAYQSTTQTRTDADQLISQIDVGDVVLTDYYNKTKINELIGEKADIIQLSNYVTLGSSQTINANKTFNNICRFVSSIDRMSTVTGSSFVKLDANNTEVLLGAGGIKPIAEFDGGVDDSNYVRKTRLLSQSITGKFIRTDSPESFHNFKTRQYTAKYDIEGTFVKKRGKNLQVIERYFRKSIDTGDFSEEDEDYITRGEIANSYVTSNSTVAQKYQVLLANGTTKPLSEFTGTLTDLSNYYNKSETYSRTETDNKYVRLEGSIQQTTTGRLKYVSSFGQTYDQTYDPVENIYLTLLEIDAKLTNYVNITDNQSINGTNKFNANVNATGFVKTGNDDTSVLLAGDVVRLLSAFGVLELITGASDAQVAVCILANAGFSKYQFQANDIVFAGSAPYFASFKFKTDGKVTKLLKHQLEQRLKARQRYSLFLKYEMSSVYLDETLLDATGLSDFPELYAYIRERYQQPVPSAQAIPIGEKTLQKQVKDNDDILSNTNEAFVPPVSNASSKLDLSSQLERSRFLSIGGSDPQLTVYSDRVSLIVSYETTGLFPYGYLQKKYPEDARPKAEDKVIALVGTYTTNKNSIFCYVDQNGPVIINTQQIPPKTAIIINITYYKKYEKSKIINYDTNND